MYCTECGKEIDLDKDVCLNCGVPITNKNNPKYCSSCGEKLEEGTVVCNKCGERADTVLYRTDLKFKDVRELAKDTILYGKLHSKSNFVFTIAISPSNYN